MTYTYQRSITDEQIVDIMESALQGITHWADEVRFSEGTTLDYYPSEAIVRDNALEIHDTETDKWETLTIERFLNGLSKRTSFNIENYDMVDGDRIVQYALFGEVRYA